MDIIVNVIDSDKTDCEFCQKSFATKGSLSIHQKTAKFCLKLQGKKEESSFKCENCNKVFTQKTSLNDHLSTCKERYKKILQQKEEEHLSSIKRLENEIAKLKRLEKEKIKEKEASFLKDSELLKEKIKEKDIACDQKIKEKDSYHEAMMKEKNEYFAKLEAKLEKLESAVTAIAMESKTSTKPTTTNNTTNNITVTNNVLNLSKEHVNKVLKDHLDYNVVYAGQAGFAKFVVDKMLKGPDGKLTYKCVDPSRQMFEFTDESGETVRDMRAEKLIQSLLDGDAIKIGLDAAAKGWNTDDRQLNNDRTETFGSRVNEYSELNRHSTVFRNKVSSLTT